MASGLADLGGLSCGGEWICSACWNSVADLGGFVSV